MSVGKNSLETLRLLADHEAGISGLYSVYAQTFPAEAEFWNGMARQEAEHAELIRKMIPRVEEGEAEFEEGKLKTAAIKSSLRYLEDQVKRAHQQKERLTPITALSVALDLENAMIEKKFFAAFHSDTWEVRKMLKALEEDTMRHRQILGEKWEEKRRS